MNNIMKIVKFFEESCLLIKRVSKTINIEAKEIKDGLLSMLLVTFGTSSLRNLWTDKDSIRSGAGTIRVGKDFNATSFFD